MSLTADSLPVLRLSAAPMLAVRTAPDPGLRTAYSWSGLLARITDEVRVDDTGFWIGEERFAVSFRRWPERDAALVAALGEALHARYFLGHAPASGSAPADAGEGRFAFRNRLHRAFEGRYRWEDGWRAAGTAPSGALLVEQDDLVLHVEPHEVRPGRHGLQVRFPADRPEAAPGRFDVVGAAGPAPAAPTQAASAQACCYLHLLPATAPEALAAVVADLDRRGVPFTASVLDDPAAFGRPDSAVVRVGRDRLPEVVAAACRARRAAPGCFGEAVPAFTRPAAPGVAGADVPRSGGEFGRQRCGILATALVRAGRDAGRTERHWAVRTALRDAGLDAAALHLDPGNAEFVLPAQPPQGHPIAG